MREADADLPTNSLLVGGGFYLGQEGVERGSVQQTTVDHDSIDPASIVDVLERIGIEQNDIGDFACLNGAEILLLLVDGASAMFGGVQVISQIRSNQKVRLHKREQNVQDYFATHPGTPHTIRIRGGQEIVAIVGSARVYVCTHKTKQFVVALQYEGEDPSRSLIVSDLTWRTLDIVQGQTVRWPVLTRPSG